MIHRGEVEARKPVAIAERRFFDSAVKQLNVPTRTNYATGPFTFRGFRVTVNNLHPSVTWRELKDFLRTAGEVNFADIIRPGVGIGEFGTPQERMNVIRSLNGKELKGQKVAIKHLNEADQRLQIPRPVPPCAVPNYVPEPIVPYGVAPGANFEVPYVGHNLEPYFAGGGPVVGPMEYHPIPFGPPPPRLAHWIQPAAARPGRGAITPFVPPFPPVPDTFGRGHMRPDPSAAAWVFSPTPPRPCTPGIGFERPVHVVPPYSQPAPPLRHVDFSEQPEDTSYYRNPVPAPITSSFSEAKSEPVHYEAPSVNDRDYRPSYPPRVYNVKMEPPEKRTADLNRAGVDEWKGYLSYSREGQSDTGHYSKYDHLPSIEKQDTLRPIGPPYQRADDPATDYPDYPPSRSANEDFRPDYRSNSSYPRYLASSTSYPKATTESGAGGKYDYSKSRTASAEYNYRVEEYGRGGTSGYPSGEFYPQSKGHHGSGEYDHPRSEKRSYGSEYNSRENSYYDRRSVDHPERSHKEEDPRGAGGVDRTRHRPSHRSFPYDR